MWAGGPVITLGLLLYGAGIGLESIARGTLPLAIFGPTHYPVMMGRIAMPSLIAQAAAPSIGAVLLEMGGPDGALATFLAAAAFNSLLVMCLFLVLRADKRREQVSAVSSRVHLPLNTRRRRALHRNRNDTVD